MTIFAKRACLENGWAHGVRVNISDGRISKIETNVEARGNDIRVDTLLPALTNLHSHSFQRAMAGMTEYRANRRDSFWTWRDLMYRFVDRLTPDHIAAIAGLTFMEMQLAGYAAVGEFHYIHHQLGGKTYSDPAEMSRNIFEAAALSGIGLTHLPVLYSYADMEGHPLAGGQLRFGNSVAGFAEIVDRCQGMADRAHTDTKVGIAPHSLRATNPADLTEVVEQFSGVPVHIHVAEQTWEVGQAEAKLGARPVEWLLHNCAVDPRWCLIHATHMTLQETKELAISGAVAGLCPVTEANLGDGIFNGAEFVKAGGQFGIGSDSNVNISLSAELRMLEYSQRLHHRERNVMLATEGSVGQALYLGAAVGGARSLGRDAGTISAGSLADMVAIDTESPAFFALGDKQVLDGLIFAANDQIVTDLWSAGRHQVQDGWHVAQDQIIADYRVAIADLIS